MDKNSFLNGNFLRKLNKQYAEFLGQGAPWNGVSRECYVKIKSFEQIDVASGERNGVSSLVQPTDKLIEVESLFWSTGDKYLPSLYINASCNRSHGFGSKKQVLVAFKTSKNNKKHHTELFRTWERSEFNCNFLKNCLNIAKLEKLNGKSWRVRHRYEKMIEKKFSDLVYDSMHELECRKIPQELSEFASQYGLTLIQAIPFTDKIQMYGLKGIQQKNLNSKLAIKQTSTYCSLPSVIEIEFRKSELNTIRLDSVGIETAGYYDHSERLKIRAEKLDEAKKLKKQFDKIIKGEK